jgi:2-methylisocitrate lyase-like PEP mutase family enzyme
MEDPNMSKAKKLRELLASPGPILSPGVYDCVSAKVAEKAGCRALSISGAAVTASILGYPDVGLQTMAEILNQARNIARSVEVPVIVDADTGYGNALNVMRAVREFEAGGLAGIQFEDQTFPKRCGHFEGKKVISTEEMVAKIKGACEARRDDDFVIVGRTDSRAIEGLDAAIERAQIYAEAGADVIFVEALLSVEELQKVARSISKPLRANMGNGSKTPMVSYHELYDMGFKIINHSGLLQRTAIKAMLDVMAVVIEEGTTNSVYPEKICDLSDRSALLGLEEFYELEERLYGPLLESEGSLRQKLIEKTNAQTVVKKKLPF